MSSHDFIGFNVLGLVVTLTICITIDLLVKRYKFVWLPESAATMMIGVGVGCLGTLFPQAEADALSFNADLFFFVLLPPIICEAGYSLKKKNFFRNISAILTFAVLGTLVSAIIIGYSLYYLALEGYIPMSANNPLECLLFGSLLSSTDPVATLAIFSSVDVPPLLYSVVFGESVLNDAVAIVLYQAFEKFILIPEFNNLSIMKVLGTFLGVSIGSLLIGVVIALLLSAITKRVSLNHDSSPHYEVTAVVLAAYISYFLAECLDMSGIMAVFFCAICLSHYNFYNISEDAQIGTHVIFKTQAQICETVVFVYLGIMAGLSTSSASNLSWSPSFIGFTMFLCLASRAIHVFFFMFVINLTRKPQIPFKMQVVIWFAGLRGAVAFALSLQVGTESSKYIITTTLGIVLITTICLGPLTYPLLKWTGMTGSEWNELTAASIDMSPMIGSSAGCSKYCSDGITPSYSATSNEDSVHAKRVVIRKLSSSTSELDVNLKDRGFISKTWFRIDNEYIKPWFGGRLRKSSQAPLIGRMDQFKSPMISHIEEDEDVVCDSSKGDSNHLSIPRPPGNSANYHPVALNDKNGTPTMKIHLIASKAQPSQSNQ